MPSPGGNDNGQGGTFNPSQLGAQFGNRLTEYLNEDAPVFDRGLYTGMDPRERQGLNIMGTAARGAGDEMGQSFHATSGISSMGGLTQGMRDAMSGMNTLGSRYGAIAGSLAGPSGAQTDFGSIADSLGGRSFAESGYRDLYGEGGGPSLTERTLGGAKYGQDSEAYQTLRSKLADDVTTQNLSAFNASGMFGSDDNRESLSEGLGTALAGMDLDQQRYGDALQRGDLAAIEGQRQQDYTNRFSSLGASDQARLAQLQTRMGALSAEDQARLAQLQARMGALGAQQGAVSDRFQMGNTGIQNTLAAGDRMGERYNDLLMPGQTLADIGSRFGEDRQAQRLDDYDRWNRGTNANYNRFRELLGDFTGSQGNAGMEEQVPLWQQLLGYVGNNVGNAVGAM